MFTRFLQSLCSIALLLVSLLSYADTKPSVVLMPLDISQGDVDLEGEFGSAVQSGLQTRYNVFYGRAVEKIINNEYDKIDCSAEQCMTALAVEFNTTLIADASVKRVRGGYITKLIIRDIVDERVIESKALPCESCTPFSLLGLLEELGAGDREAQLAANTADEDGVELATSQPSGDVAGGVAALIFDSVPSGADVYIGGAKAGVTPYHNFGLRSGQAIDVVLKKQDYRDLTFQVPLDNGINQLPNKSLTPAFGSMELSSTPSGAEVYLAGQKVGTTPYRSEKSDSGNYFLSLRKSMYLPLENHSIEVRDGEKTTRHFTLTENFGRLTLKQGTPGTQIDIVGEIPVQPLFPTGEKKTVKHTKTLPLDLKLEPGQYQVALSKNGFETKEFNVRINRGQISDIKAHQTLLRQMTGSIMISTAPFKMGAKIYLDNEFKGTVPAQLVLPVGNYELRVETEKLISQRDIVIKNRHDDVVTMEFKQKIKGKNKLLVEQYEAEIADLVERSESSENFFKIISRYQSILRVEPQYPAREALERIAFKAEAHAEKAISKEQFEIAKSYIGVMAKASPDLDRSRLQRAIRNSEQGRVDALAHARAIRAASAIIHKPFKKPGWMDLLDEYAKIREELKEASRHMQRAQALKPNDEGVASLMSDLDLKYAQIIETLVSDENEREARLFINDASAMGFKSTYSAKAAQKYETAVSSRSKESSNILFNNFGGF